MESLDQTTARSTTTLLPPRSRRRSLRAPSSPPPSPSSAPSPFSCASTRSWPTSWWRSRWCAPRSASTPRPSERILRPGSSAGCAAITIANMPAAPRRRAANDAGRTVRSVRARRDHRGARQAAGRAARGAGAGRGRWLLLRRGRAHLPLPAHEVQDFGEQRGANARERLVQAPEREAGGDASRVSCVCRPPVPPRVTRRASS